MEGKVDSQRLKKVIKRKYGSRKAIRSKKVPRYPRSAEREYRRDMRKYVRLLGKVINRHLPNIMKYYKQGKYRKDGRFDDTDEGRRIRAELLMMYAEYDRMADEFGLEQMVKKAAENIKNQTYKSWKSVVRDTFEAELDDDYYDDLERDSIGRWEADNINKAQMYPKNALRHMGDIILTGLMASELMGEVEQAVRSEYSRTLRYVDLFAWDQVGNLTSELSESYQTDAGVETYIWRTMNDDKVRESHAELEGTVQRWDSPPLMWYETRRGIVYTNRCHPGQDYNCRCMAEPVFNLENLSLHLLLVGGFIYNEFF